MTVLSAAHLLSFHERGFCVLENGFDRDFAAATVATAYRRMGFTPGDSRSWENFDTYRYSAEYSAETAGTWEQGRTHLPAFNRWRMRDAAPRAAAAVDELLGAGRADEPFFSDGFVVNVCSHLPWQGPEHAGGWHKDGDWYTQHLDGPEQGLLMIFMWTDTGPKGGGTYLASDSVRHNARLFARHPEGLPCVPRTNSENPMSDASAAYARAERGGVEGDGGDDTIIGLCANERRYEMLGNAGDIALVHPWMLHCASGNTTGVPRFITNTTVALKRPMDFNRSDPAEFSHLERSVLHALGVPRLAFEPTGLRERRLANVFDDDRFMQCINRERKQQRMLVEEKRLLSAAGQDVEHVEFMSDYHSDGVEDGCYSDGPDRRRSSYSYDSDGSRVLHKL
jgi:hypothetical protein